jgi:hypothetical protein
MPVMCVTVIVEIPSSDVRPLPISSHEFFLAMNLLHCMENLRFPFASMKVFYEGT